MFQKASYIQNSRTVPPLHLYKVLLDFKRRYRIYLRWLFDEVGVGEVTTDRHA
jgi:hypothetical protein